MERSAIREPLKPLALPPDFAALHPGYGNTVVASVATPLHFSLRLQRYQILQSFHFRQRHHMNRRNLLKALAGLAACPICTTTGFAAEGAHWSYEGAGGPAKWGDLDAANKACSLGAQQSPINIVALIKSQLPALKLSWSKTADTIANNGHTIQLNFAEGSALKLGDTTYKLLQVHFHGPSEHLIGGKSFPMKAHFVHRADSGALAVVGVMFSEGKPNATFGKIVATMPAKEGLSSYGLF
jgi:carbonic anhydrase